MLLKKRRRVAANNTACRPEESFSRILKMPNRVVCFFVE